MPELPEVESIRRYLQRCVEKKKLSVKDVIFHRFHHKNSHIVSFDDAPKHLSLQKSAKLWREHIKDCIITFQRRGKYLLFFFHFSDKNNQQKDRGVLAVHLRMSGAFFHIEGLRDFVLSDHQWKNHVHVTFVLGKERYVFFDPRTFGKCHCFFFSENFSDFLAKKNLGAEASDIAAVKRAFSDCLAKKSIEKKKGQKTIKSLLLDQKIVCGLGNIYVNESLFFAGVHPERKVFSLTPTEWTKIATAIEKVIKMALDAQGVTLEKEGGYRLPDGRRGRYIARAFVYGRVDKGCFLCGALIKKIVQNARSTFFCAHCQK